MGPPTPKVTGGRRGRTGRGQGLGGAGRSAAVGVNRPIARSAVPPRHLLPGRRSPQLQTVAARSGGEKTGDSWGSLPRANPALPVPQSPHRSPTGSLYTTRFPLSLLADPRLPDFGTRALKGGRVWRSARPPSGGSWAAPQDRESRSSPAFPGWPVVGLMWAASPVAGMIRRRSNSLLTIQRRQPWPKKLQGGRATTGSQIPPPSPTRLLLLPMLSQSLPPLLSARPPGLIPPNQRKGR